MRDIEGIEEVVAKLRPHMGEIDARFNEENARFKALMGQDHDIIGRVLKCHLVIEHYLDRFLSNHYGIADISAPKLSFFQKAKLLPDRAAAAAFVKPAILCLNSIRNRFGHSLEPRVILNELQPMLNVLVVVRPEAKFVDPIDAIEAFTTIASTWLIVPPPSLQQVFMDAFSTVKVNTL